MRHLVAVKNAISEDIVDAKKHKIGLKELLWKIVETPGSYS